MYISITAADYYSYIKYSVLSGHHGNIRPVAGHARIMLLNQSIRHGRYKQPDSLRVDQRLTVSPRQVNKSVSNAFCLMHKLMT